MGETPINVECTMWKWDSFLKVWSISLIKIIYDVKFFCPTLIIELHSNQEVDLTTSFIYIYSQNVLLLNCAYSVAPSFVWDWVFVEKKITGEYTFCF